MSARVCVHACACVCDRDLDLFRRTGGVWNGEEEEEEEEEKEEEVSSTVAPISLLSSSRIDIVVSSFVDVADVADVVVVDVVVDIVVVVVALRSSGGGGDGVGERDGLDGVVMNRGFCFARDNRDTRLGWPRLPLSPLSSPWPSPRSSRVSKRWSSG